MNILIGIGVFFLGTLVLRLVIGTVPLFTKYASESQRNIPVLLKIWNVIEAILVLIGFVYLVINYYF